MGADNQRLDRLARGYGLADGPAGAEAGHAWLATLYESFAALPAYQRATWPAAPQLHEVWPDGTAERLMRALVAGQTHTFVAFNARGDRVTYRIGPLPRDPQTGRTVRGSAGFPPVARLDVQLSYCDGPPLGRLSFTCPDGVTRPGHLSTAYGGAGGLAPGAPTARQLRHMVVDAARRRGEADLLARALGLPLDAWIVEAPDHYDGR